MGWAVLGAERSDRLLQFMFEQRSDGTIVPLQSSEQILTAATLGALLAGWSGSGAQFDEPPELAEP